MRVWTLLALALVGCGDPNGSSKLVMVGGTVLDETDHPIEGASVTLLGGPQTIRTDQDGAFALSEGAKPGELLFGVSAPGYGRTWLRRMGLADAPVSITVQLKTLPPAREVTLPAPGETVTVRDGMGHGLIIPDGAFCTAGSTPVTGTIDVTFIYYDPLDARLGASFVSVLESPGVAKVQQRNSAGELDVIVTTPDGTRLDTMCPDKQVTLVDTLPDMITPAAFAMFLDPSSASMEGKVPIKYDARTHEASMNTRDLLPHCPAVCNEGYCPPPFCGDGICGNTIQEIFGGCREDCPPPYNPCGNGSCESFESCGSCAADCGACPPPPASCGDHSCNGGESCGSCPQDCGDCPPPPPYCGDGSCNGDDTCSSCESDCGRCPQPAYVSGTVLDIRGKPASVQITASTEALTIGQMDTVAGAYKFDLGMTTGSISALVSPAPKPQRSFVVVPVRRDYPGGVETHVDFQYCIVQNAACNVGDRCCGALTCIDGYCN